MIGHILSHDYFTFKPIIMFQCSGFLSVNYNPGLTKYLFIYFSAINLKKMDSRILKLRQLVSLDLTGNLIKDISMFGDLNANKLDVLKELKLASNQVTILFYIIVLTPNNVILVAFQYYIVWCHTERHHVIPKGRKQLERSGLEPQPSY